jgi:formate hydrogenlyase subunit 6/NADH:ubiquinone oxidoreductase subunit I
MEALELGEKTVLLNLDRCIGCGLCVTTCPTESLVMVRKPEAEQPEVPKNMIEASLKLGKARGKI